MKFFVKCSGTLFDFWKTNYVGLPDPNHNLKLHPQLIVGSSPAVSGQQCFDLWHLKMSQDSHELYQVEDYVSDSIVRRLCSSTTLAKFVNTNNEESSTVNLGNITVTWIRIAFISLQSYVVNVEVLLGKSVLFIIR